MAKKPSEQTKTSFIKIPVKSSLQTGSDASHPVHISHTEITIPVAALLPLKDAFDEFAKVLAFPYNAIAMIGLQHVHRILVCTVRKSYDGLCGCVEGVFGADPLDGATCTCSSTANARW